MEVCDRRKKLILNLPSWFDHEYTTMIRMIDGCECPCNANSKVYINGITTGNITNTVVGRFVIDSRNFASKRVWSELKKNVL